jgi:hypothetical protein
MLLPPTKYNLDAYEKWIQSKDQDQVFFASIGRGAFVCELEPGDTFFIPSGVRR